jgi:hypothetical protein
MLIAAGLMLSNTAFPHLANVAMFVNTGLVLAAALPILVCKAPLHVCTRPVQANKMVVQRSTIVLHLAMLPKATCKTIMFVALLPMFLALAIEATRKMPSLAVTVTVIFR